MKDTLSSYACVRRLEEDKNADWSDEGAKALVQHLEEIERECETETEFDETAIRCDFSEYGTALEAVEAIDTQAYKETMEKAAYDGRTEEDVKEMAEEEADKWLKELGVLVANLSYGGVITRNV